MWCLVREVLRFNAAFQHGRPGGTFNSQPNLGQVPFDGTILVAVHMSPQPASKASNPPGHCPAKHRDSLPEHHLSKPRVQVLTLATVAVRFLRVFQGGTGVRAPWKFGALVLLGCLSSCCQMALQCLGGLVTLLPSHKATQSPSAFCARPAARVPTRRSETTSMQPLRCLIG